MIRTLYALVSLLFLTSTPAQATPSNTTTFVVNPFIAQYSVLRKSDPVGTATRQLDWLGDGTAKYSYHTALKIFFMSDKRSETSIIALDGNKITPKHYTYSREGTGRDKHYEWRYDASKNSATNVKTAEQTSVDFSRNIQDSLSYHLQNRVDLINNPQQKSFSYPVIKNSGTVKDYKYEYDGEEKLSLPYGELHALRFKRETSNKKRVTYVWFAPELNYLLVKIRKIKSGKEQFQAQLSQLQNNPPQGQ